MKLEELYRTEHEGKTLIAIGNGSSEIESVGRERIGRDKFYISTSGKWVAEATGSATQFLYALEEKDFDLFDAYDSLPEGFEMVGYGTGFQIRDDYELFITTLTLVKSGQKKILVISVLIQSMLVGKKKLIGNMWRNRVDVSI